MPARREGPLLAGAFLTGAGALALEVLFIRALTPVLGAAPRTLGAVAAAFLLALALGSLAARRAAGRSTQPLRAFAILSAGAGILGIAAIRAAPLVGALGSPSGAGAIDLGAFLAAFLLALAPALLMGAAFPFLAEASPSARPGAGRLYGVNTLGGVAGALAAPLAFLPALGVSGAAVAAGVLEAVGGALALAGGEATERAEATEVAPSRGGPSLAVLALMAAVSALALGAEIAFARLLVLFLRNSVYTVATLLAGFLLGNGWGSALLAGRAARSRDPWRLLALLLGGAAIACAGAVHAVSLLARASDAGATVGGPGFLGLDGIAAEIAFEFALALPVVVVPAFFFGAAFPSLLALAPGARPGEPIAALIGASGVGSVAGSFAAALGLVPVLGASRAVLVIGFGAAGLAVALLLRHGARWPGFALGLFFLALAAPVSGRLEVYRGGDEVELVAYDEGPAAAVAVVRERDGSLRLKVNNTYSQGGGQGVTLERRQGQLAMLLAAPPVRRALTIGVGTGHTLAGLLGFPGVESVEAVEILPEIARSLPLFARTNGRCFEDARVSLRVADGRRVVRERAGTSLDLVIGDLFFPWESGAGSLFTREQFVAIEQALRPGGTVVQWLPLHQLADLDLACILRTFKGVFPDAALFLGAPGARQPIAALVARRGDAPLEFSIGPSRAALGSPSTGPGLAATGFADEFDALALFVASGPALRKLAGPGPINSDDRPFIELHAPGAAARSSGLGIRNLETLFAVREAAGPRVVDLAEDGGDRKKLSDHLAAFARLEDGFLEELRSAIDPRARYTPSYEAMYIRREEDAHLAAFEAAPGCEFVRLVVTERVNDRLRSGAWGEALSLAERLAAIEPPEAAWRYLAGLAHLGLGEPSAAAESARLAIARRPDYAPDHLLLAQALAAEGRHAEAEAECRTALRIDPQNAGARKMLAAESQAAARREGG